MNSKFTDAQIKYNSYVSTTLDVLNKMVKSNQRDTLKLFSYLYNQSFDIINKCSIIDNNIKNHDNQISYLSNKIDDINSNLTTMSYLETSINMIDMKMSYLASSMMNIANYMSYVSNSIDLINSNYENISKELTKINKKIKDNKSNKEIQNIEIETKKEEKKQVSNILIKNSILLWINKKKTIIKDISKEKTLNVVSNIFYFNITSDNMIKEYDDYKRNLLEIERKKQEANKKIKELLQKISNKN